MADLGAVFDEHVASEFVAKDVDATMQTMVAQPYVWHVPPPTGASGGDGVRVAGGHPASSQVRRCRDRSRPRR